MSFSIDRSSSHQLPEQGAEPRLGAVADRLRELGCKDSDIREWGLRVPQGWFEEHEERLLTILETVDPSVFQNPPILGRGYRNSGRGGLDTILDGLLRQSTYLPLLSQVFQAPQFGKELLKDRFKLPRMDLGPEGRPSVLWETFGMRVLELVSKRRQEKPSSLQPELDREMAKGKESNWLTESKDSGWFKEIEAQGYTFDRVLGRTKIFHKKSDGSYLAVKWQKKDEPLSTLYSEYATVKVLQKNADKLQLLSELPEPVGVYAFKSVPSEHLEDITLELEAKEKSEPAVAYVYKVSKEDYFHYLHAF